MTGFFAAAVALLALGAGVLLWPLLRRDRASPVESPEAVVALFRERLAELEAERASGALAPDRYEQSRREVERQLIDAVAGAAAPAAAAGPNRARWTAALVGIFVVLAPIGLYINLGAPGAMVPGAIPPAAAGDGGAAEGGRSKAGPLSSAQVQKMIDGLNDALKKNPGDAQGWTMLARAYAYQHQYAESVHAFTKAVALTPRNARLLADMADAMAMANGQRLEGEPEKLLDRALQIDPKDIKALALAGTAAFDRQEYAKAVAFWERAIQAAPDDREFAATLRSSVDEARKLAAEKGGGAALPPAAEAPPPAAASGAVAGGGASAVRGKVTLASGLAAKAQPGDTIFVFARAANGPKVPLALLRRQVKDLPFEFSLDDSMAMMPEYTLSKFAPVIVGARVSHSGDAIAAAGDLQGFSKPVAPGTSGVNITIDQVVN
jgi:cytochrome c-type biogenesis protein CcmH